MRRALERRREALARWHAEGTDGYRLLHGVAEGTPGLAVDRYGPILLVQTWRDPLPDGALEVLRQQAEEAVGASLVAVWNHRPRPVDFDLWHRPEIPADLFRSPGPASLAGFAPIPPANRRRSAPSAGARGFGALRWPALARQTRARRTLGLFPASTAEKERRSRAP